MEFGVVFSLFLFFYGIYLVAFPIIVHRRMNKMIELLKRK